MSNWLREIGTFVKDINMHQVEGWLQQYSNLGPLPGILLPFCEAFFPFLPLVVFVMGNAAAYGLWWGFLFSWIGVCAGAVVVRGYRVHNISFIGFRKKALHRSFSYIAFPLHRHRLLILPPASAQFHSARLSSR